MQVTLANATTATPSAPSAVPSGPTSAPSFANTTSDVDSVFSPSDHHFVAPSLYESHNGRRWWFGFSNCDGSGGIFITTAKMLIVNPLEFLVVAYISWRESRATMEFNSLSASRHMSWDAYQYELIGRVVERVSRVVNLALLHVADCPIGLRTQMLASKKMPMRRSSKLQRSQ